MSVSSSASGRPRGRAGLLLAGIAAVIAMVVGGIASAALLGGSAKGAAEAFLGAYVDGDCDRVAELSVERRREYLHSLCEQNAGEWQVRDLEVSGARTDQDRATVPVRLEARQKTGGDWGAWATAEAEVELRKVDGEWLVEDLDQSGG